MSPLSKALFLVLFPLSFFSVFFHRCFPFLFARRAQSSLDHCPFWPAKCSREEPGNPATGPDNGDQILQVTVQAARSVYDPMRRIASAPRPRNYHRFLVLRNSAASTANAGVTVATAPQLSARKTGRMEYFALFFFLPNSWTRSEEARPEGRKMRSPSRHSVWSGGARYP